MIAVGGVQPDPVLPSSLCSGTEEPTPQPLCAYECTQFCPKTRNKAIAETANEKSSLEKKDTKWTPMDFTHLKEAASSSWLKSMPILVIV